MGIVQFRCCGLSQPGQILSEPEAWARCHASGCLPRVGAELLKRFKLRYTLVSVFGKKYECVLIQFNEIRDELGGEL